MFQIVALYAPGRRTMRVRLHRWRGVKIGERTSIGLGAIIEGAHPSLVSIGDNVRIGVRCVMIAHFRLTARRARIRNEPSIRIEDNVYIGPSVTILPNVTIGHGAVVAAGSVVKNSVPPLTMVEGNPAKPVAICGISLRGNSYEEFIRNLKPIEGEANP